jgi:hypothetical protein
MSITLYGIANCDTVKRARAWLADHGVEHRVPRLQEGGRAGSRLNWNVWLDRGRLGAAAEPQGHGLACACPTTLKAGVTGRRQRPRA